jgi:hypothetical protein
MQLPEPDPESTTLPIPLLNNNEKHAPMQMTESVTVVEHMTSSNLNSQLILYKSTTSMAKAVAVPAQNTARSGEQPLTPTHSPLLPRSDERSIPEAIKVQSKKQLAVSTPGLDTPEPDPESAVKLFNGVKKEQFSTSNTNSVSSLPILEVSNSPRPLLLPQPEDLDLSNGIIHMEMSGSTEALLLTPAHNLKSEMDTEGHQSQETYPLDVENEPSVPIPVVTLSPDVQITSEAEETIRPEAEVTQSSTEKHVLTAPSHSSPTSPTRKPTEKILEAVLSLENNVSSLDQHTQPQNGTPTVLPRPSTVTGEVLQTSVSETSIGQLSIRVPKKRPSQEIVHASPLPTDYIQEIVTLPQDNELVDDSSELAHQPKQQIHITLSGLPAWERPVIFETSPWTDTVFAPVRTDMNGISNFENLTLTTLGSESTTSVSSSGLRKRELVIETLKRMCRRDFVTEDDLETMYPGVGCFITAFTIKGDSHHQIPYTGQFSLRKTHLYSSNPKWWKDFAFLSPEEMTSLSQLLAETEDYTRSLVLLKWLRKERLRFWSTKQRALVAIIYNEPISLVSDETEVYTQISGGTSIAPAPSFLRPGENMPLLEGEPASAAMVQDDSVTTGYSQAGTSQTYSTKTNPARPAILYMAFTMKVFDPHNIHGDSTSVQPTAIEEGFTQSDIAQRIRELNCENPSLIRKKLGLLDVQQDQISKVLEGLTAKEQDSRYAWNLLQLEEVDGPSKGLRVVTIYLRRTLSASVADDLVSEHHEAVPENRGGLGNKPGDDEQKETIQAIQVPVEKASIKTNDDLTAGIVPAVSAIPVVTPHPTTVNFERESRRKQKRKSRRSSRHKSYSSEETSSSSDDSDESNISDLENKRRKKARKRRKEKSSRKRNQSREEEKEKAPGDPQSLWEPSYPPYYNGGPPYSPYVYPGAVPSPYGTPYPSMGAGPYSSPNPMAFYPGNAPPYGYGPDQSMDYGNPFSPYPSQSYPPTGQPPASSYYTPPPGAGYFNTIPPQTPAPPRAPMAPPAPAPAPAPAPNSGSDSDPEIETRSERIRKASERKATIRPSASRQQPLHLRSRAENPTSTYSVNPPPSTRPQSYYGYGQPALPPISYGEAQTQSSYSRYGATPSAPPISQSAYAMPPPPSSYSYPPRRMPMPYPEYYDGRSYNPLTPLTEDERNNTNDIVQKLLLDWTPAGDELKKKQEKEREEDIEEDEEEQENATTDQDTSDFHNRTGWRSKYKDDSSDNAPGPSTARAKPAYMYEVEEADSTGHTAWADKAREAASYQEDVGGPSIPLTAEALRRRHAGFSRSNRSAVSRQDTAKKRQDERKKVESERNSYRSTKAEVSKREYPQVSHRRGSEFKPKDKGKERLKDESRESLIFLTSCRGM